MFTTMLLAVVNPKPLKVLFSPRPRRTVVVRFQEAELPEIQRDAGGKLYHTEPLLLMSDAPVPDDCNLLIIAGPQTAFKEAELQKIDQYLTQGGRLFVLFNYFSRQHSTGLEPILQKWGVNVIPDVVQDFNQGGEIR